MAGLTTLKPRHPVAVVVAVVVLVVVLVMVIAVMVSTAVHTARMPPFSLSHIKSHSSSHLALKSHSHIDPAAPSSQEPLTYHEL